MAIFYQNHGQAFQIRGGGITQSTLDRITELESTVESLSAALHNIIGSKATETDYGLARISESTAVTETGSGLVLSAKEKNPSIDGTLAREIKELKKSIEMDAAHATLLNGVTGAIALYRIGKIVFISTYFDDRAIQNTYNWKSGIAVVPEGYRPIEPASIPAHYDGQTAHVLFTVKPNGDVSIWCSESSGGVVTVTSTYFTQ